jgi:hypothetical protein
MKISEAIREGSKLRPMLIGSYFEFATLPNGEDDAIGSCALGAAYEGATDEQSYGDIAMDLRRHWPELFKFGFCGAETTLAAAIIDMNDSGLCTREDIAAWLESLGL